MLLTHDTKQNERLRNIGRNLGVVFEDIEQLKTYINNFTLEGKPGMWEGMSQSTVLGHSSTSYTYLGNVFDGRYVYYTPFGVNTLARYDTTLQFGAIASWATMNLSTAVGTSLTFGGTEWPYFGNTFDGRYIYYAAYWSHSFLRYDTTLAFTNSSAYATMSMSSVQGAAPADKGYAFPCFDGKYIYFSSWNADTFLRFDTTQSFTNSSAWERISGSTALDGTVTDDFYSTLLFDGRYIYYCPYSADTFLRFDTTQSFTNSSAWEKISMSTAQGAATLDAAYFGSSFDGRYVYFVPISSDTFLRFDSTLPFTNSSAWQRYSMSTATGGIVNSAYNDAIFDGRYIYYCLCSAGSHVRFDTTLPFSNSGAWQSRNSISAGEQFYGLAFDGRYMYLSPSNSATFWRRVVCPSNESYR